MALHHPQIRRAVELAQGGELGALQVVNGTFSFLLELRRDPRIDPGHGRRVGVGRRVLSGQRARRDRRRGARPGRRLRRGSTSAASTGRSSASCTSRAGCWPSSTAGSPPRTASGWRSSAAPGRLVLDAPFLADPDGPPAGLTLWRGTTASTSTCARSTRYALEVDDLVSAILDGTPAPRCRWRSRAAGSRRSWSWTAPLARTPRADDPTAWPIARRHRGRRPPGRRGGPRRGRCALGLGVLRRSAATAGPRPAPVRSRRPLRPASTTRTTGPLAYFAGGGVAVLDCDDDGRPDLYVAGGITPPPCSATRARPAAICASQPVPDAATDLSVRDRRLPARHRR